MINPYKEAAPWARLVTLIAIGAAILYGLGRWDGAVDERLRQLQADTDAALAMSAQLRATRESLRAVEDSLAAADSALAVQERRAVAALAELQALAQREVDSVASSPVEDLLPALRMRPILREADTLYATDERGVRVLSGRMLRLAQLERELPPLRDVADTRARRIETLLLQVATVQARADTAEVAIDLLEPLAERWRSYSGCKILGLISCPSRTTSLVVGAVAGGAIAFIATRR